MRTTMSVTELARSLADAINRVLYRGERFTILRGGKPVAEIVPVPVGRRLGDLPDLLASLPRLGKEGAASFAEDIDSARHELAEVEQPDPWAT